MAKDSDYVPAKRSNSDACSENSISIPSTTAAQKANSRSSAPCSADHSSAIPSDIGSFLNVLVILQKLRLITFQIIVRKQIVILIFYFTQLMIREGNLIFLGCKVTHSLHIQRL